MREGSPYVSGQLYAGSHPYEIYKMEGDRWLLLWKCRKPSPEKIPLGRHAYAYTYTVSWKVERTGGEVVEQYRRHDGLIIPVMTVIAVDENGNSLSRNWLIEEAI